MAILISQAAVITKNDLDDLGPVTIPLTSPVARLTGRKYLNDSPGIDSMGIWECSPGRWQRTILQEEFAHFLSGHARFFPEGGEPIDIRGGDTIWFPKNSRGVWEIEETVRKVYVIIDRPGFLKRCKTSIKQMLAQGPAHEPSRGQPVRTGNIESFPLKVDAGAAANTLATGKY